MKEWKLSSPGVLTIFSFLFGANPVQKIKEEDEVRSNIQEGKINPIEHLLISCFPHALASSL